MRPGEWFLLASLGVLGVAGALAIGAGGFYWLAWVVARRSNPDTPVPRWMLAIKAVFRGVFYLLAVVGLLVLVPKNVLTVACGVLLAVSSARELWERHRDGRWPWRHLTPRA